MKKDLTNLPNDLLHMQTRVLHIGGATKQNALRRTIRKNFIGCLRNVG
jgi:hypothetical protein